MLHLIVHANHEARIHGGILVFRVESVSGHLKLGRGALDVRFGERYRGASRRHRVEEWNDVNLILASFLG